MSRTRLPVENIVNILGSVGNIFDREGKLHPPSHEIWEKVSSQLEKPLRTKYLWQIVWEDRHNIQTNLRIKLGMDSAKVNLDISSCSSLSSSAKSETVSITTVSLDEVDIKPISNFILIVSPEIWKVIEPIKVQHRRRDRSSPRVEFTLAPGWTNQISDLLWEQHRIPCPYQFKKCRVIKKLDKASHYLKIKAFCVECNSEASGTMMEKPVIGEPSEILWRAVDSRNIPHYKKRRVSGMFREKMAEKINIAPSIYRRKEALAKMSYGDPEPPTLPTSATIRKITQEHRNKKLGMLKYEDPFSSLMRMKDVYPFAGVLHDICGEKFFVTYHSPAQRSFYAEYRKIHYTILRIDVNGSLVRKIRKPGGYSGHILLYEAVLNTGNSQLPVLQMVSERHDANIITFWLSEWERFGMNPPQQVVSDYSKAILSALARSFGRRSSLSEYKEKCFRALMGQRDLPPCFIRIDIAHFKSSATNWPIWKTHNNRRVKEFYLRCLGLLVKCNTLEGFKNVLHDIFCCSLAETVGKISNSTLTNPSELSRDRLLDLFEKYNIQAIEIDLGIKEENSVEDIEDEMSQNRKLGQIEKWVDEIFQSAAEQAVIEGDRISPYFSPEVAKEFYDIALDFTLWSGVLVTLFGAPNLTATSGEVEGDFNDLRNRILQNVGPLAAHKFVVKHIRAIESSFLLVAAPVVIQDTVESDSKGNLEGFNYDDWKALTLPPKKKNVSKYTTACPEIKTLQEANKLKPPPSFQLLRNGNLTGLLSVGNNNFHVLNTCIFDAVCQILTLIYTENENFRERIKNTTNLTMRTATSLVVHGASEETYKARLDALSSVIEAEIIKPTSTSIIIKYECFGNISTLLKKLFEDMPSLTINYICNNSQCKNNKKNITLKLIIMEADIKVILGKGLSSLQSAVEASLPNIRKCCNKGEVSYNIGSCFFIDIESLGIDGIESVYGVKTDGKTSYAIKDVPNHLKIYGNVFTLRGIVAYQPAHYISYGRHISGQWDCYDDIQEKVAENIKDDSVLLPTILIYSI